MGVKRVGGLARPAKAMDFTSMILNFERCMQVLLCQSHTGGPPAINLHNTDTPQVVRSDEARMPKRAQWVRQRRCGKILEAPQQMPPRLNKHDL